MSVNTGFGTGHLIEMNSTHQKTTRSTEMPALVKTYGNVYLDVELIEVHAYKYQNDLDNAARIYNVSLTDAMGIMICELLWYTNTLVVDYADVYLRTTQVGVVFALKHVAAKIYSDISQLSLLPYELSVNIFRRHVSLVFHPADKVVILSIHGYI